MGSQSRVFWGVVLSVVLVAGATHASAMVPAWASGEDPSWADVEAARDDAAATDRQLALIDDALTELENRSAVLGDAAVEAGALATTTRTELDEAVESAAAIAVQRASAQAEVESASEQLGRITAATYRVGAGGVGLQILLGNDSDDDVLYQLTVSARLGSAAQQLRERATTKQNLMASLDEQAEEVARERDRLAVWAETRADDAVSAQRAADEELARQEQRSGELFAQLAALKDTSADLEREYRARITAEAAYEEQQERAATDAQKSARSTGSAGPGAGMTSTTPTKPTTPPKPTPTSTPTPAPISRPVPTPTSAPAPTPTTTPTPPPMAVVVDPAAARAFAAGAVSARGWSVGEYNCLVWLWDRESNWRADAHNPYSGAYGIPQSLPGNKMATAGDDWRTNAATQVNWGLGYIANRYGAPCAAWAHSETHNWY